MKTIALKRLHTFGNTHAGYVDLVLARASVENGIVSIEEEALDEIHKEQALPPIGVMSAAAIRAVIDESTAVISGVPSVSSDELQRRVSICTEPCEFFRPSDSRCSKCGCFMAFKARLRSQQCPAGRW